jgi:hypothetical protein
MQRKLGRRKTGGFTILEVSMAGAVLALAIGSALIAMGRAFSPLDSARCISYASQIMQSEMEKMRLTSWGDGTAAGNGTTGITSYPLTATNVTFTTSGFTSAADLGSRMTLTRTARAVHTGMIEITLEISWTTSDRRPMSRKYITYYGKNGLYDLFV